MKEIHEKRLTALYNYAVNTYNQNKLLLLLLSIISAKEIKIAFEELNLKIK